MRTTVSFILHDICPGEVRDVRLREQGIPCVSRTSTLLAVMFWSCRLKEGVAPQASTAAWGRWSHAGLGNCALSSSLLQNFCVVPGKFLKLTLSGWWLTWVLLVLRVCGWRFRVWCEGALSSHSWSWGNAHCALETESGVLNKLRNQVLGSTQK